MTGNPGTVRWKPRRTQVGRTFAVTFTAQATTLGVASAMRHVKLHVAKPKPRPKPRSFVLSSQKHELYRYAFVIRAAVARSAPRQTAAVVAGLAQWTPEGTTNLVETLEGRRTRSGVWIKVRLPILPANRTGWVKRKALSDWKEVRTRLVVDRRRLSATLYRRGKVTFRAPVGVGSLPLADTTGEFFIRNQLYGFGNPVYGDRLRHERPLTGADGLARRRLHRHPRDEPAASPARARLARLHPHEERPHPPARSRLMPVGTPLTVR